MVRVRRLRKRGFTLMEVLLVAGILAILAAFAVPQLFKRSEKAKIDLSKAAVGRNGNIGTSLEHYRLDVGRYPDTDEGLAALYRAPSGTEKWQGPYLDNPPSVEQLVDPWGNPFGYKSPGEVNETSYDLWCYGPDGQDDGGRAGSDDIKNWAER